VAEYDQTHELNETNPADQNDPDKINAADLTEAKSEITTVSARPESDTEEDTESETEDESENESAEEFEMPDEALLDDELGVIVNPNSNPNSNSNPKLEPGWYFVSKIESKVDCDKVQKLKTTR